MIKNGSMKKKIFISVKFKTNQSILSWLGNIFLLTSILQELIECFLQNKINFWKIVTNNLDGN